MPLKLPDSMTYRNWNDGRPVMNFLWDQFKERFLSRQTFQENGESEHHLSFDGVEKHGLLNVRVHADVALKLECAGVTFRIEKRDMTGNILEKTPDMPPEGAPDTYFALIGETPSHLIPLWPRMPVLVGRGAYVHQQGRMPLHDRFPDLGFAVENTDNNNIVVTALEAPVKVIRHFAGIHSFSRMTLDFIAGYNAEQMINAFPVICHLMRPFFGGNEQGSQIVPSFPRASDFAAASLAKFELFSRVFAHDQISLVHRRPVKSCPYCFSYLFGMLFEADGTASGILEERASIPHSQFGILFYKAPPGKVRIEFLLNLNILENQVPYKSLVKESVRIHNKRFK